MIYMHKQLDTRCMSGDIFAAALNCLLCFCYRYIISNAVNTLFVALQKPHRGRDNVATILQMAISNSFP